jgi:L-cysteine S-thiosulfotransferase
MKKSLFLVGSISLALAGCATVYSNADYEKMAAEAIEKSFTAKGIATKDRIKQDSVNLECTRAELAGGDLPPEVRKRIETENMRTIKYPADGNFMGDWKAGERLAQSGRGSTYSDKAGDPNGGNCYNCHQISKEEISHGTLGPTLYQFGKLRGNSEAVLKYTWGKLYNAKAYNACTNMPRFGHQNILTEAQMKDLMALLLDPNSPVNK